MRELLFRLAFQAIVGDGPDAAATLAHLVKDQPSVVRAAWLTMLGRMLDDHRASDAAGL
ncbi:hypothetical protein [Blastococcus brunescens]|uniref:HEAT repeat domain-containing protein n=1 Tax=Blastococcus brunescens TaxID=1564165 RepID=A0ABZ1B5B2_9ACTN|nr:hypothetical protein [Blastococcus sp. BMG 8361]WRL65924.1 hypothetical protein U6N30_10435 [Blastococcus sp. BMG 8361]